MFTFRVHLLGRNVNGGGGSEISATYQIPASKSNIWSKALGENTDEIMPENQYLGKIYLVYVNVSIFNLFYNCVGSRCLPVCVAMHNSKYSGILIQNCLRSFAGARCPGAKHFIDYKSN